jgi:hypothetical protein
VRFVVASGTLTRRSEGMWRRGRERLVCGRCMEKEKKKGGDGRMG